MKNYKLKRFCVLRTQKTYNHLKGHIDFSLKILSAIYLILIIFKNMYLYFYSYDAEKFYGIPRTYFYDNVLGDFNLYIIFLLLLGFILFYPIVKKKYVQKPTYVEAFLYSFLISILFFYIFLIFVSIVIDIFNMKFLYYQKNFTIIIILIGIVISILYCIFYVKKFMSKDIIEINRINKKASSKRVKLIEYVAIVPLVIIIFILILYLFLKCDLGEVKKYEVIFGEGDNCKIIVGEYDHNIILLGARCNRSDNKLTIKRGVYEFKKRENYKINYILFDEVSFE